MAVATGVHRQCTKWGFALAQLKFLFLVLWGLLLVAADSILLAPPTMNAICMTSVWPQNAGHTLELVPLLVKILAIHCMMAAAKKMKRVQLNRSQLIRLVAGLTTLTLLAMGCWTIFDPKVKATECEVTN